MIFSDLSLLERFRYLALACRGKRHNKELLRELSKEIGYTIGSGCLSDIVMSKVQLDTLDGIDPRTNDELTEAIAKSFDPTDDDWRGFITAARFTVAAISRTDDLSLDAY